MGNGEAGGIRRDRGTKLPREVDGKSQEELRSQQQPGICSHLLHCPALPTEHPPFFLFLLFTCSVSRCCLAQHNPSAPYPPHQDLLCAHSRFPQQRGAPRSTICLTTYQLGKIIPRKKKVKPRNHPQWGFPCHTSKGKCEK